MPPVKEKKKNQDLNLLPQNIEAEEAVLGAILVNPRVITKVVESLKPESFYKPAHRYIYEAMLELFNQNEKIDIISVSDVLSYNSKLDAVGGRSFINDLSFNAITTSNVEYYAKIIQEKAIKRALINAGSEIVTFGYDMNPIDESLDNAEKLIFDIASRKSTSDLVHVKDLVLNTYEKIEYRYNHKDELLGVPTGFFDLDVVLNGLQKSDLIILAARPAMGKTAFALNIAQNVAIKAKVPVAIFSLEMSKDQLVQRMLCSEAEIDSQRMKTGNMQSKDWEKLADAMNSFAQAPVYIDDTSGCTITDIRAKCRRLKMEEKNLGLILIDYLQLMEGSGREDRMQQISAISRGLKILAKELDVPVIALSQLSRAVESRTDKRPMLSDLRESGSIEQDADIVMFIYRDEYYRKAEDGEEEEAIKAASKGESEIIIAKHRNGGLATVKLLFQGNITKFKNPIKTDAF
ncbi:TPA: replicative DNA helicase [Candidatus Scatousia excrementigallinarum]|uniref:Replicative DNA helicase n=1 Tax=Candidatus Scatousia excrementigallinarum TaxID=2840935 RepID=A0A9D1EX71_9BACT|nr:replicative DNA helicase [Candidatus Scatousia excrementigallinarum]